MIRFRELPDQHPDFVYSPLLRAARLTLGYMVENGPIGITKTKALRKQKMRSHAGLRKTRSCSSGIRRMAR